VDEDWCTRSFWVWTSFYFPIEETVLSKRKYKGWRGRPQWHQGGEEEEKKACLVNVLGLSRRPQANFIWCLITHPIHHPPETGLKTSTNFSMRLVSSQVSIQRGPQIRRGPKAQLLHWISKLFGNLDHSLVWKQLRLPVEFFRAPKRDNTDCFSTWIHKIYLSDWNGAFRELYLCYIPWSKIQHKTHIYSLRYGVWNSAISCRETTWTWTMGRRIATSEQFKCSSVSCWTFSQRLLSL